MFILVSPAKKMAENKQYEALTPPNFLSENWQLAQILKQKSAQEIAKLMDLSPKLAELNWQRFQDFAQKPDLVYAAVHLFNGDTFLGLQAHHWHDATKQYAQNNLGILSGFYGILRPFDAIQPYRLEMGCALSARNFKNLYEFWGDKISQYLKQHGHKIIVNCASQEYSGVVDKSQFQWLDCDFKNYDGKNFTAPGMFIKRLRGALAREILHNQYKNIQDCQKISVDNYHFNPELSTDSKYIFVKNTPI